MTVQSAFHNSGDEEFLDVLLQKVKDFLPLLQRDEIVRLLAALSDSLDRDIRQAEAQERKYSQLLRKIDTAAGYPDLKQLHDELNELEMERFLQFRSVPSLHGNCTEYRDLLAGKTVAMVEREFVGRGSGTAPCRYALISMGSDGREEQTLITDQDYLIVYDDGGGEAADIYFRQFAESLVERLAEIGFKKCTGDIMPSNQTWRGSCAQWRRRLTSIVRYEFDDYARNLMDLIVVSDARFVAGDNELAADLIETIRSLERDYFHVLWGMAKAATEMKLALGFLKSLWTEGSGEHKGEFNLKLLAWAPLVMNIRILAINQGIPVTNTVKRIEHLQKEGSLSPQTAHDLIDAYQILTKHRILLQIKVIKGIQKDSYYLNPFELPHEERERIRHALIRIEELQKMIHTNFHIV